MVNSMNFLFKELSLDADYKSLLNSVLKDRMPIVATGLSDNDVLNELVIDEFKNIKKGFYSSQSTKKQIKRKPPKNQTTSNKKHR